MNIQDSHQIDDKSGICKAIGLIADARGGRLSHEQLGQMLTPPVSQQSISKWVKQGFVPKRRAQQISALTRGAVPVAALVDPALVALVEGGANE